MRSNILLVLVLVLLGMLLPEPAPCQATIPWDMELAKDRQAKTTVSVANRCFASHSFELSKGPEMAWFNFIGEPKLRVSRGENRAIEAQIDTRALEPGIYRGEVLVKCTDCAKEPGCSQDRDIFSVRLKVIWSPEELERLREGEFVVQQILVMLDLQPSDSIDRIVQDLEARFPLRRVKIFELRSIPSVAVLFAILDPQLSVALAINVVQADPRVLFAQPNYIYTTLDSMYNDAHADLQYGPRKIKADLAHKYSTGKNVKIAIVDTGIDFDHVDLRGRIVEKANFVDGDKEFAQDLHGTLVAGVIAARPNNRVGIYGIAPDAKILAIKVCKPRSRGAVEASGSSHTLAQGLDFAILKGAKVINLSLGGPKEPLISKLVDRAFAEGIILIAAAGNDGPNGRPRYPAALDKVIAVSAIDVKDELYGSANRGDYIDFVAPGVDILSTMPGGRFNVSTGTSMAAPHLAGVAALILQKKADISPRDFKSLLEATARDLGTQGRDDYFGAGCVDACKLLAKLTGNDKLCN